MQKKNWRASIPADHFPTRQEGFTVSVFPLPRKYMLCILAVMRAEPSVSDPIKQGSVV
jgi:hypothetical protein